MNSRKNSWIERSRSISNKKWKQFKRRDRRVEMVFGRDQIRNKINKNSNCEHAKKRNSLQNFLRVDFLPSLFPHLNFYSNLIENKSLRNGPKDVLTSSTQRKLIVLLQRGDVCSSASSSQTTENRREMRKKTQQQKKTRSNWIARWLGASQFEANRNRRVWMCTRARARSPLRLRSHSSCAQSCFVLAHFDFGCSLAITFFFAY